MFRGQEMHFSIADAMFPGTGAAIRDRPVVHPFHQRLGPSQFFLIIRIEHQAQVIIAIANMPDNRRIQPGILNIPFSVQNTVRQF